MKQLSLLLLLLAPGLLFAQTTETTDESGSEAPTEGDDSGASTSDDGSTAPAAIPETQPPVVVAPPPPAPTQEKARVSVHGQVWAGAGQVREPELGATGYGEVRAGLALNLAKGVGLDLHFRDRLHSLAYRGLSAGPDGTAQTATVFEQNQNAGLSLRWNALHKASQAMRFGPALRLQYLHLANPLYASWGGLLGIGANLGVALGPKVWLCLGGTWSARLFGRKDSASAFGLPRFTWDWEAMVAVPLGERVTLRAGYQGATINFERQIRSYNGAVAGLLIRFN